MNRKCTYLLLLLLCPLLLAAQNGNTRLLNYFKQHGGGACFLTLADWKQRGTDSVTSSNGMILLPQDAAEAILRQGRKQGNATRTLSAIAAVAGMSWKDSLVRLYIPAQSLDALSLRLPAADTGTVVIAITNKIPLSATDSLPDLFRAAGKSELLAPDTARVAAATDTAAGKTYILPANKAIPNGTTKMLSFAPLVLFLLFLGFLGWQLRELRFSDLLSENAVDKRTIENPGYKELPAILKAMSGAGDQTAQQAAKTAREQAEQAWQAAQQLSDNSPADDALKTAAAETKTKLDAATAAENAAATSGSGSAVNPALVAGLANLFPPTIETSSDGSNAGNFRPSSSRLIALLSGVLLVIIALGMSCFYIYACLCTGYPPELSGLSTVLVALGFGMAPYAINKITGAAGKNNNQ